MKGSDLSRVRLFFAFWPDGETRERMAALASGLTLPAGARAVPRENYHVTIAFVGDVPRTQMRGLEQIGCAQQPMRCALKFDAFEYWPKPQVAVAAAREISPELEHFWQALHRDLALLSLALEPKRLRPHLTLARHVPHSPEPGAAPSLLWSPREFSLVHSDTSGSQSVYTVVDTWPLLDTASSG